MEISVSFTDGDPAEYADGYTVYESPVGHVYVPVKGVIIEEPAAIRYERHPWIERFEFDGIRPEPARREGFGKKSIQGFVLSLGKVYDDVLSDYDKLAGEAGLDAEGLFRHVTERMIAEVNTDPEQFRRFAGFTENMWRLGDEPSYELAMGTIVPQLMEDKDIRSRFTACITDEFREALIPVAKESL